MFKTQLYCRSTVEGHVLTRSGQDLTQAWAGQTHFNIGGSARLGRAHIRELKCVQSVLKHVGIRYVCLHCQV